MIKTQERKSSLMCYEKQRRCCPLCWSFNSQNMEIIFHITPENSFKYQWTCLKCDTTRTRATWWWQSRSLDQPEKHFLQLKKRATLSAEFEVRGQAALTARSEGEGQLAGRGVGNFPGCGERWSPHEGGGNTGAHSCPSPPPWTRAMGILLLTMTT